MLLGKEGRYAGGARGRVLSGGGAFGNTEQGRYVVEGEARKATCVGPLCVVREG